MVDKFSSAPDFEPINDLMARAFDLPSDLCRCRTCVGEVIRKRPWPHNIAFPFIVCETCGNKRCPHAEFHENACTNSNEPGQPGSGYPLIFPKEDH